MSNLLYPNYLWLLLLIIPGLTLLFRSDAAFQRRSAQAWGQSWRHSRSFWLRAVLFTLGSASLVLALARPVGEKTEQSYKTFDRGVLFLVDVSRSMLAEDLKPSRLERAKLMVSDVLTAVDGQEVGLIAFSGTAVVKSPLTTDYNFFRMALNELSAESVSRGGSLVGDALRAVERLRAFQDRALDVIILTDGEDQDSFPKTAAAELAQKGLRLFFIGLGDDKQGQPIPIQSSDGSVHALEYQGQTVLTKQDSASLQALAQATSGSLYLNWGRGNGDLGQIYTELKRGQKAAVEHQGGHWNWREFRDIFLALALLCFLLEAVLTRRRQP